MREREGRGLKASQRFETFRMMWRWIFSWGFLSTPNKTRVKVLNSSLTKYTFPSTFNSVTNVAKNSSFLQLNLPNNNFFFSIDQVCVWKNNWKVFKLITILKCMQKNDWIWTSDRLEILQVWEIDVLNRNYHLLLLDVTVITGFVWCYKEAHPLKLIAYSIEYV